MGGYADYALATKVPALWARMQKDQAQKRTGDLAKNMFAQLDGLDPQSKEYFQRMRQLSMESGDDTLYQTGEGLNKAQQGYVWDDPMLTGHWKDFLLEGGDPNDKNAFAAWNDRRASQSGTKVNITMPGQPGFDWSSPVPMEVLEKATPGTAEFIPGMTWSEFRSSGAKMPGKTRPEFEAQAGKDAFELSNSIRDVHDIVSDPSFLNRSTSDKIFDAGLETLAQTGPAPMAPLIRSQQNLGVQKLAAANAGLEEIITKIKTGAAATETQTDNFRRAFLISDGDHPEVKKAKVNRISNLYAAQRALGMGLKPEQTSDGRIALGQTVGSDGIPVLYIMQNNGDIIKIKKKR